MKTIISLLSEKKDDYRFSQITQYIQDNINSQIRTKDIAKYVHLSDKQISRIIKVKTGLSTKQYINQLRMEKAKKNYLNMQNTA